MLAPLYMLAPLKQSKSFTIKGKQIKSELKGTKALKGCEKGKGAKLCDNETLDADYLKGK